MLILQGHKKAAAIALAKSEEDSHADHFLKVIQGCAEEVRLLHSKYLTRLGVSSEEAALSRASPACHHYTSFLLATAYHEPVEVLVAAMLPCPWIYNAVSQFMSRSEATDLPTNPFSDWITTYASASYGRDTVEARKLCDTLAAGASALGRQKMHDAFDTAFRLEYMFWESAYRLGAWVTE
jgi:thiaminase (transcriptional activator TenA)